MGKELKGDKYIYYAMAYRLAKENGGDVTIGYDNRCTGGQMFVRRFALVQHNGRTILDEIKTFAGFTDFHKCFSVEEFGEKKRPHIFEFIENGDNHSDKWRH